MTKERDVIVKVMKMKELIKTDQTGKLPLISSWGSKYLMVMCEVDGNIILVATMKNQTEERTIKAYQSLVKQFQAAGIQPKDQMLDNEAFEEYKEAIRSYKMTYELIPPDMQ